MEKSQTAWDCAACDGPSYLRRSVTVAVATLQFPGDLWRPVTHVTVRPAPPSWRSETRFLAPNSQKLKCFATGLTTVRRGCDGTSCRSVTIYRESIFSTRFSNSKCHGTEHPRRSVEPVTVRRWARDFSQFFQNLFCCSKRLNRSLQ